MKAATGAGPERALAERARRQFRATFGRAATGGVAVAPGRVNLIGEHTDYNDGFVLPMAIDRHVAIAAAPGEPGLLRVHGTAFEETVERPVAALRPGAPRTWADYVLGAAWVLREEGLDVPGLDLLVTGTLPIGGGLSSSAAVELATLRLLVAEQDGAWEPTAMARLGQRAETEFVGVRCGIMDQLVVACAVADAALLVDCRSLELTPAPVPDALAVVVMDTAVPRSLAASAYNDRREACERAVRALQGVAPGIRALRDVAGGLLREGWGRLDPRDRMRVQHVLAENARPADLHAAFVSGDLARAGRLLDDSHWSLRDLYEVSCAELDLVTDLARAHPACLGARMTGAGFGGAAIALVYAREAQAFVRDVEPVYRAQSGRPGRLEVVRPVGAVSLH